ncbi:GNAT family N-acetyltransferase [Intestinibacillus massiliensis]|nr:GNAT family N-acetyltransferase [Intestinibacillus massiliensis]
MVIRRFTPDDRQAYLGLAAAFYADGDAVDHPVPAHHAARTFDALMAGTPYADAFLAEEGGAPLGFILLAITWSNEAGGLTVWVEELLTLPQARGKGVGRALLDQAREAYPGANRFRLEVTRDNARAIRLYESIGYKPLPYDQMILDFPPPAP